MKDIRLSIIIPVYNVEQYVQSCIDSIIGQWDDNCEIILVDDGSTDSSGSICDRNEREHIKVIHKSNGGLSSARNEGLKYAKGKYISFIDSDDLIENDSLRDILKWIEMNDADIYFMQAVKFYPDGFEEPLGDDILSDSIIGLKPIEVIRFLASRQKYPGSACTKIYKRDFLEKARIAFPHDRRQSEDLGFIMDCLMNAKSFSAIDTPYYRYRQNRIGSITNGASSKAVEGLLVFEKESIMKLTTNNVPNDEKSLAAMSFVAYEYMVLLHNYASLSNEEQRQKKAEINRLKWVLKYSNTPKARVARVLSNTVGVDLTASLFRWTYKRRLEKKNNVNGN